MHRFIIYFNDKPVGHSNLEFGDPQMCVAFGRFHPAAEFEIAMAAPEVRKHLLVKSFEGGELLNCEGIGLQMGELAGIAEIEVEVLGIQGPQYDRLFPEHVATYEKLLDGGK